VIYWADYPGSDRGLFVDGEPIVERFDEIDGVTVGYVSGFGVSRAGKIAFVASTASGNTIFTPDAVVAQVGVPIHGIVPTAISGPEINNAGRIAFVADTAVGQAIVSTQKVIAQTGGSIESFIYSVRINNKGQVSYRAKLTDGSAIYRDGELVRRTGDAEYGSTVTSTGIYPDINSFGETCFFVITTGNVRSTVTSTKTLITQGDVIGGVTISDFIGGSTLNDSEEAVAYAVTPTGRAIVTQNAWVLRTGDILGGKTVADFASNPYMNSSGVIALTVSFTDGSQSIVRARPPDRDGDALRDLWEEQGFTVALADGTASFVNLPFMGASVDRKDVFVEVDWMVGQAPTDLSVIEAAFDQAPVDPDGMGGYKGIKLHIRPSNELPYTEFLGDEDPKDNYRWRGSTSGKTYFEDLKSDHFTEQLAGVAHYCIFAHRLDFDDRSDSGIAWADEQTGYAGSDFIVSLGDPEVGLGGVGTIAQQSGTFMHELGHNLGLRHGGNEDSNRKPNYISVMNYYFQMGGVHPLPEPDPDAPVDPDAPTCPTETPCFDYSRETLPDLNERSLIETAGVGAASGLRTAKKSGSLSTVVYFNDASGAIDWNESEGTPETTAYPLDLNGDNKPLGPRGGSTLTGFNDWPNLIFDGGSIGRAGVGGSQVLPDATVPPREIDAETYVSLGPAAPGKLKAHAASSQTTITWNPVDGAVSYHIYRKADGVAVLLGVRAQSNFHDKTAVSGVEYLYSVASVGESGNEGSSASVIVVTR